jgi:thiamine pyrophosphokinase
MAEARGPAGVAVLVFAGGDPPLPALDALLPHDALVIGADSGVEHAHSLGRRVDIAVGDFDSVAPDELARAEARGARVHRYPPDKDATDLELALHAALAEGASRVTVVGGHGGRADHHAANLLLLGAPALAAIDVDAWFGTAHLTVVRSRTHLRGAPGDLVSLVAVGGTANGVTTEGLRFPLDDEPLLPGSTRGVSNELVGTTAEVSLRDGVLLAIQPHALRPDPPDQGGTNR